MKAIASITSVAITVAIDQYAEKALGNRNYVLNKPYGAGYAVLEIGCRDTSGTTSGTGFLSPHGSIVYRRNYISCAGAF